MRRALPVCGKLVIALVVPIRIEPERNLRDGPFAAARRAKEHKRVVTLMLDAHFGPRARAVFAAAARITVTIERRYHPPSKRFDGDNCDGGAKAVRDAIARWIGIDDGDARFTWRYGQRLALPEQIAREVVAISIGI